MPVWAADRSRPLATEAHLKPLSVDVIVIGAGITGALIAETTTALGLTTVILDRRPPIGGSTAASTALLQFEIDMPLVRLADHIGFANASRVWRRSYNAVDDLERMVRRLQISCAFRSRRSLYLAGTEMGAADLKEEARQRRAIGLPSVFLDQGALHGMAGIDRAGAILSEGAGMSIRCASQVAFSAAPWHAAAGFFHPSNWPRWRHPAGRWRCSPQMASSLRRGD
jgi:glycine/D-amino acid oxidase-like deaminating enzyme